MAHYQTWAELPEGLRGRYTRPEELLMVNSGPRPVPVADDDWERNHWAWLGFEDRLAIGCGCQDCADLIYDALMECRKRHGYKEMP